MGRRISHGTRQQLTSCLLTTWMIRPAIDPSGPPAAQTQWLPILEIGPPGRCSIRASSLPTIDQQRRLAAPVGTTVSRHQVPSLQQSAVGWRGRFHRRPRSRAACPVHTHSVSQIPVHARGRPRIRIRITVATIAMATTTPRSGGAWFRGGVRMGIRMGIMRIGRKETTQGRRNMRMGRMS